MCHFHPQWLTVLFLLKLDSGAAVGDSDNDEGQ